MDPSLEKLIEDMIETMYHAPGIGLAATQVGKPVRVIVFDLHPREEGRNPSCLINPEIIEAEGRADPGRRLPERSGIFFGCQKKGQG